MQLILLSYLNLEGKTALVTVTSAKVATTYTSTPSKDAENIASNISSANAGRLVKAYKCNVRLRADVEATVDTVVHEIGGGRLDIVVTNAGIVEHVPAQYYPEDKFREIFDVNVKGTFWTAQSAARVSFIFTASVSATLINRPQKQAAYNASKAALIHLGKLLAVEGIDFTRVNLLTIHPNEWREQWHEMIPSPRFSKAADLK
ncbi:hypothetical protein F5B20DRAFT_574832 [Whalleya microplaca]|nr:hypothetical protein F5B20DRAFT_574832 [Whalleya microplaca]